MCRALSLGADGPQVAQLFEKIGARKARSKDLESESEMVLDYKAISKFAWPPQGASTRRSPLQRVLSALKEHFGNGGSPRVALDVDEAFGLFDPEERGYVTRDEAAKALQRLMRPGAVGEDGAGEGSSKGLNAGGEDHFTEDDLESALEAFGPDEDGRISRANFAFAVFNKKSIQLSQFVVCF